ncbi:MAG: hypothetical protein HN356_07270 [Calditrichaeota bacterium]|nr:hypothetical protein [Calditrichota bacterium]
MKCNMSNWGYINLDGKQRIVFTLLLCVLFPLINGCSLRSSLTVWATRPLIDGAFLSLMSEPDPDLAKTAMEADLKILEGLLELRPDDSDLLMKALQGYTGYALLFLEDEHPKRAVKIYQRARNFGFRILAARDERFLSQDLNYRQFKSILPSLRENDLPAVYWTSNAWFASINIQKTPSSMANIPIAKEMMQWVLDRDPHFFYSGPLWFFGAYYASLPPMLGGSAVKSKEYFESALEKDGQHFIYGKYLYAKYFATQTLNRDLFLETLEDILNLPENEPDDLILINRVTQQKSVKLMEHVDELF